MRAILYCRTTDATDNPENYSFFNGKFPAAEIIEVCGDSTGNNLPGPVFEELMVRAERKEFDILVIKALSRISRNLIGCLDSVNRCRALGITLVIDNEWLIIEPENGQAISFEELLKREVEACRGWKKEIRRRLRADAENENPEKSKGISRYRHHKEMKKKLCPTELGYEKNENIGNYIKTEEHSQR